MVFLLDTWVFVTMIQVNASCLWQESVEICFDLLNIVAENRCESFIERVELETRKTVYLFCAQLKEWIMIYRKNHNHWAKISEKRPCIPRGILQEGNRSLRWQSLWVEAIPSVTIRDDTGQKICSRPK